MTGPPSRFVVAVPLCVAAIVAGCGSSHGSSVSETAAVTTSGPPPAVAELPAAEQPTFNQFPSPHGRSIRQLSALAGGGAQLGAATGTFTPGLRRFAFGLNTSSGAFIYAPTAVYLASGLGSPASGPFLAPADPMTVAPQYRSKQNTGPGGIQAIYAAQLPVHHPGTYSVLALTRTDRGLIGSVGEIAVASSSPIPDVGQRPPDISTDTPGSVGGRTSLLTTRIPPDDMHAVSFNQVLGKRPIALLFSTPQLCTSRVCGPVTDVVVSLEHRFSNSVTFIHEEVYVNNQPSQGLRPQLKAFHLETEPWLFTIDRHGIIRARLEGAFGVNETEKALEAALR